MNNETRIPASARRRHTGPSAATCDAARHASSLGLIVHAGHGMNYHNVQPIASIHDIVELNIGHAIVARSLIDGMARGVSEMKRLMVEARAASAGA